MDDKNNIKIDVDQELYITLIERLIDKRFKKLIDEKLDKMINKTIIKRVDSVVENFLMDFQTSNLERVDNLIMKGVENSIDKFTFSDLVSISNRTNARFSLNKKGD